MKLFISYSRDDAGLVTTNIVEILRSGGHDPWFDRRLLPGQEWKQELHDAIKSSDAFVYLLSPRSVVSEWCQWEFAEAVKMRKPLLPILLHKDTEIPKEISRYQYVDFSAEITVHNVAQLMGGLTQILITHPIAEIVGAPHSPRGIPPQAEVQQENRNSSSVSISPQSSPLPNHEYGTKIIIRPPDKGFAIGTYTDKEEFQAFEGRWGWSVYYRPVTRQRSTAWVQWLPQLPASGDYEVSVFVPDRHATTQKARYKIHGVTNAARYVIVELDQSKYVNMWAELGAFHLDLGFVNPGAVFSTDLTYETGREIAFDAIRWRQIVNKSVGDTN